MKKIITLILAAGLFVYAINGNAAPKDSSWLSAETVMTSSIDQASDGQSIGMISIWAGAQPIPDGWLECNGQAVNAEKYPEYVAKFGATTPDYRGFFLRGLGGKSGALGVTQGYAVQTNGYDTVDISGFGLGKLDYVSAVGDNAPSFKVDSSTEQGEGASDDSESGDSGVLSDINFKYFAYYKFEHEVCGFTLPADVYNDLRSNNLSNNNDSY